MGNLLTRIRHQKAIQRIKKRSGGFADDGRYISGRLKKDRLFVLAAVKEVGFFLKHASEELRGDMEIVMAAVRQHAAALKYASEELRGNREVVMAAVRQRGLALWCALREMRADREVVLEAVLQSGMALQAALGEVRADREIVLIAVQRCGWALQWASEELRGNREIVMAAIQHWAYAFVYASEELRADRDIVVGALDNVESQKREVENVLSLVPTHLQNVPMVAAAIIRNGGTLRGGTDIMTRLENVLLAVRALPEADFVDDEESLNEFYRRWERSTWHKIWMALQLEPPGMPGIGRIFVEFSGLPLELRLTQELRDCTPVIDTIFSFPGLDWRDLYSYRVRKH